MQDIAAEAGVSIGTVSRVLNGKPDVTAELAERVMRAAQTMGYSFRYSAQQPSNRPRTLSSIGYIVDSDTSAASDPFQQHFLSGIEQSVTERGGHVVFSTCQNEAAKNVIPPMVVKNLVSGVILKANHMTPKGWIKRISDLIPVVLLMHRNLDLPLPSVICDNRGAIYQSLRYLSDLGHTKIGYFHEGETDPARLSLHHEERSEAYQKLAPLFGVTVRPGYIQAPVRDVEKGEDLTDVSHKAWKNFLALGSDRPTAIICAADIYALTMIRVADSYGLEIPRDVSLLGMMNTHSCEFSNPPLTSVSLGEEEIGRAAVDLLEEQFRRPAATVREIIVGTQLVERGSCGKSPA